MKLDHLLQAGAQGDRGTILVACHTWFHEHIGGSSKIATDLAEHLAATGYRVCYVCGTREHAFANPTMNRGVELWRYRCPARPSPHPANLLGHVRGTYRLTRQILRAGPITCVNGHTPLQFLGSLLAARGRCERLVYSVHSPFAQELGSGRLSARGRLQKRLTVMAARAIDGFNCRHATTVQCYSDFSASVMAREFGARVHAKTVVKPGWVDVDRFKPAEDIRAVRTALGSAWQTEGPVFLTVRRLEHRMGLESLIRAAGILAAQGLKFRLLIGGAGVLEETLRRQVCEEHLENRVQLLGRISEHTLPLCFAAADCFVLPTRALECFGLIILEAFACGTPVIGTPVGAIPELVSKQGEGWLTPGTGCEAIAERMAAFARKELTVDRTRLRSLALEMRAETGLRNLSQLIVPHPV